ncbi:MAG TPA: DoxX family protein [Pyrinomonadaceae bacterium]|jgi:putative oxidoreductase
MTQMNSFYAVWTPRVLSLLRIVAAFMLIAHGAQKLFGFMAPPGMPGFPPMSQMWVGGVLEFFGGLLLLLGLFTRPVAFILSGTMAVAYFQMHAWTAYQKSGIEGGLWPIKNQGELAALYCFVFLLFAVAGGGAWSIDRLLGRERS